MIPVRLTGDREAAGSSLTGGVPRFTGKTRITGKTDEIPERPKNI